MFFFLISNQVADGNLHFPITTPFILSYLVFFLLSTLSHGAIIIATGRIYFFAIKKRRALHHLPASFLRHYSLCFDVSISSSRLTAQL